jgi:hypothetical protein
VKTPLTGWFSLQQMGATAGDLLVRDLVSDWIRRAGASCDMAVAPPFSDGVDRRAVNPAEYERGGIRLRTVRQRLGRSRIFSNAFGTADWQA